MGEEDQVRQRGLSSARLPDLPSRAWHRYMLEQAPS